MSGSIIGRKIYKEIPFARPTQLQCSPCEASWDYSILCSKATLVNDECNSYRGAGSLPPVGIGAMGEAKKSMKCPVPSDAKPDWQAKLSFPAFCW